MFSEIPGCLLSGFLVPTASAMPLPGAELKEHEGGCTRRWHRKLISTTHLLASWWKMLSSTSDWVDMATKPWVGRPGGRPFGETRGDCSGES
jgi:hypothetical protein